jgi:hypothetical protein
MDARTLLGGRGAGNGSVCLLILARMRPAVFWGSYAGGMNNVAIQLPSVAQ